MTKDRIRGPKGDKHYETRKRSSFYYMNGNCCSMICQNDWYDKFGDLALDHFGRIHEPKRQDASGAWYKQRDWQSSNHYFVNDLLGERRPITTQQYDDESFVSP